MIVIRECRGFEELQACVDLQIEVWGYSDGDVIPRRVFLVAQKIGGQAIGAFEIQGIGNRDLGTQGLGTGGDGDASSMVGFAFGLPGVKTGAQSRSGLPESYLHSHMLAVKEGYRNQNIGARLKLAQREDALRRGIERMEWTFDPVEIKNAFLNIHKLGAVVRRYEENFYGVSSSRLQGGLQTDRLVAEWWIASDRVAAAIEGQTTERHRTDSAMEIVVPGAIYEWKADDEHRHRAQQVQAENRRKFQQAFSAGLAVVGFSRDAEGNGTYHLDRWAAPQSESGHKSRDISGTESEESCVKLG
jgi:predicted GNAT superfamily acetyltransferase